MSGIQEQLNWVLLAWGLGIVVFHEVTVKVSAGTAVIGGLDWDRRLYFQDGPLAGQAKRCWLLLGGLGSSARAAAPWWLASPRGSCPRVEQKLQCHLT